MLCTISCGKNPESFEAMVNALQNKGNQLCTVEIHYQLSFSDITDYSCNNNRLLIIF